MLGQDKLQSGWVKAQQSFGDFPNQGKCGLLFYFPGTAGVYCAELQQARMVELGISVSQFQVASISQVSCPKPKYSHYAI